MTAERKPSLTRASTGIRRFVIAVAGLLIVLYLLPSRDPAVPVTRYHLAMDTAVRIDLFVEESAAEPLFDLATAEIDRLDSLLSHYSPTSEVSSVNAQAATLPVAIGADLERVLQRSLFLSRHTQGAFDVSLGALTALWDFPHARRMPDPAAVDSALSLSGYKHLELADARLRFAVPGLRLDLGATAKGYVVDQIVDLLQSAGAPAGLIEAGGDLRYWGEKPDGRPWRFGIQHPRHEQMPSARRFLEVADIGLAALATSGDYERFFELDGRRYHHILDPRDGYPARSCVSATVWAHRARDADILSTTAFVLGPQAGLELVKSMPNTESLVFYEKEGQLRRAASAAIEALLSPDAPVDMPAGD